MNNLKIITWNMDIHTNRKEELLDILQSGPDIVLLQETGWKPHNNLQFHGYQLHREDRQTARAGGTAVLTKSSLITQKIPCPLAAEGCSVKILLENKDQLIVSSVYVKTGALQEEDLNKMMRCRHKIIAGGDINARHIKANSKYNSKNGTVLFNHPIKKLYPQENTHQHHSKKFPGSVLDYFITNMHLDDRPTISKITTTSDHRPVELEIKNLQATRITQKPIIIEILDLPALRLQLHNWEHPPPAQEEIKLDPEKALQEITATLQIATFNNTKCITLKSPKQHPMGPELRRLKEAKHEAELKYRKHKSEENKKLLNMHHRRLRREIQKKTKKKAEEKIQELADDPKMLWKYYKKATKPPDEGLAHFYINGAPITNDREKANLLAQAFQRKMSPSPRVQPLQEIPEKHIETQQRQYPDIARFVKIITDLPKKKASGMDGIKNEAIQALNTVWKTALYLTLKQLYLQEKFPTNWKTALVKALRKPGKDPTIPENHRPISLLSNLSKLQERLLEPILTEETINKQLIPNCQFGFRAKHSTTLQLTRIMDAALNAVNNGEVGVLVTLDVEAAFDKVPHEELLYKLQASKIDDKLIANLHQFLQHRHIIVKVNGEYSEPLEIEAGVPQGAISSPPLYSLYTADIPETTSILSLYADDTALLKMAKSIKEAIQAIQEDLNKIFEWADKWRIKINAGKTQAIIINPKGRQIKEYQIHTNKGIIRTTDQLTLLGLTIDNRLTFKPQARKVIKRSTTRFHQVRAAFKGLPPKEQLHLYKSTIQPILLYGMEATPTMTQEAIGEVQVREKSILRYALHAPRRTPIPKLYLQARQTGGVIDWARLVAARRKKLVQDVKEHPNPLVQEIGEYAEPAFEIPRIGDCSPPTTDTENSDEDL